MTIGYIKLRFFELPRNMLCLGRPCCSSSFQGTTRARLANGPKVAQPSNGMFLWTSAHIFVKNMMKFRIGWGTGWTFQPPRGGSTDGFHRKFWMSRMRSWNLHARRLRTKTYKHMSTCYCSATVAIIHNMYEPGMKITYPKKNQITKNWIFTQQTGMQCDTQLSSSSDSETTLEHTEPN